MYRYRINYQWVTLPKIPIDKEVPESELETYKALEKEGQIQIFNLERIDEK